MHESTFRSPCNLEMRRILNSIAGASRRIVVEYDPKKPLNSLQAPSFAGCNKAADFITKYSKRLIVNGRL